MINMQAGFAYLVHLLSSSASKVPTKSQQTAEADSCNSGAWCCMH